MMIELFQVLILLYHCYFPTALKYVHGQTAQLAMLHIRAASGLSSFKRIQGCTSIIAASRSGPRHVLLACAVPPSSLLVSYASRHGLC